MQGYHLLGKVGEGTFGEVFKAKHIETGLVVALKRIRIRKLDEGIPSNLLRELQALQQIDNYHVIHLYESFPFGSSIVISFEFMLSDLYQMMKAMSYHGLSFSQAQIKSIMIMMLQGLVAVHNDGLMHRDLKPANLLFSSHGVLKLGDFGLARVHDKSGMYTHEVATRWYRAPELLFGSRKYTEAVDIWVCVIY